MTVYQSDELPWQSTLIRQFIGQDINTCCGVGVLAQRKDGGYGIKIKLCCDHEGCSKTRTFYLTPGPGGPDHYVRNSKGKYLADLRDQGWTCPEHR